MGPTDTRDFRVSYNFSLPGSGLARIGKATALPRSFTARLEYPEDHTVEMDVAVEDGTPRCSELRVIRNPGLGWLNGTELRRFPLQRWLEFVCANAGMVVEPGSVPGNSLLRLPGEVDSEKVQRDVQRATRRRSIDDDFLREVADAYRVGGAQRVKAELGPASDSQVFRWVRRARERGILSGRAQ